MDRIPPAPHRSRALVLIAAEPLAQAGGQGALGGQVIFQRQDAHRGGQGMALVEQLPDPRDECQLAARVATSPASRALRGDRARSVQSQMN